MKYRGFKHKKTVADIEEYILASNGLRVLLCKDTHTAVVGVMVTYHVGSRNEALGYTGATHLLEHLMFKGSKNYNQGKGSDYFSILEDLGAKVNATTWFDRTNYYAVIESGNLEEALAPEADRMRNAFITEADRVTEMPVVRSEFEIGENKPLEALDKEIWALAYQAHPYHHSTIGWKSDIENVPIKKLQEFYNTFYWPNNATVTLVGNFNTADALTLIKKHFGKHKSSPGAIPDIYTVEPKQEGPRRTVVKRVGNTNIVGIAHKTPSGLSAHTYALQVLGVILGMGKTSRLHRRLIDRGKATDVSMFFMPFKDNGLFATYIFLNENIKHSDIETLVKREYKNIQKHGVSSKELAIAKAKIRAEFAFSRDGAYARLSQLNEAIAVGDWTFYETFSDMIQKVTRADVRSVANLYLTDDQSVTGYFIGTH